MTVRKNGGGGSQRYRSGANGAADGRVRGGEVAAGGFEHASVRAATGLHQRLWPARRSTNAPTRCNCLDFAGDNSLEVVEPGKLREPGSRQAEVFRPPNSLTVTETQIQNVSCEAVWSQRKEDLIKACQNAFEYFGGVTAASCPTT